MELIESDRGRRIDASIIIGGASYRILRFIPDDPMNDEQPLRWCFMKKPARRLPTQTMPFALAIGVGPKQPVGSRRNLRSLSASQNCPIASVSSESFG